MKVLLELPVCIQLSVVTKDPVLVERDPPVGSKVGRDVRPICDASVEFDHSRVLALQRTHGIGKRILEAGDRSGLSVFQARVSSLAPTPIE